MRNGFKMAVKVAQKADIAILVLGENEQTSREAWAVVEHPGDRDNLDLLGNQDDLVKAIVATGKPVVVFLLHGRPIRSMPLRKLCRRFWTDGIWGQETGTAVGLMCFSATTILGASCRSRWPRSTGQLPDYYYQKPSGSASIWEARPSLCIRLGGG